MKGNKEFSVHQYDNGIILNNCRISYLQEHRHYEEFLNSHAKSIFTPYYDFHYAELVRTRAWMFDLIADDEGDSS